MRRLSLTKAMQRSELSLTTIPNSQEFQAHRRRVMMDIVTLRMLRDRLDHLGGIIEAFILENGVIVIRQFIIRTRVIYWYRTEQTNLSVIEDATELENYYSEYHSTMD